MTRMWKLSIGVVAVVVGTMAMAPQSPPAEARPSSQVLWGVGDELDAATASPLYRDGTANMATAWYNGPGDLAWMSGYSQPSTISDIYGAGKSIELVVFLADHADYAVSDSFQRDVKTLVHAFKGSGPHYGPLYVVLFTEWETYSPDPTYQAQLKKSYLAATKIIHAEYGQARVALGFGGYEWSAQPSRDLGYWTDAIAASDFTAVQAMQDCRNEGALEPQVRSSVQQLGTYHKPVMISHFKVWGSPQCQRTAFTHFASQILADRPFSELVGSGLFAWGLMDDSYISGLTSPADPTRVFLRDHAASR